MADVIKTTQFTINKQGPPEVMVSSQKELPAPSEGEVLLKQEAISVNFVDTLFRNGTFPLDLPSGIGVEAAGTVVAKGPGVDNIYVGDRVVYRFVLGAYAESRLISTEQLLTVPQGISFEQAAALHAKGLTARMLVKQAYAIQPGDVVLVHAAAGGVGSLVSRWAKSMGATVIGTVGSSRKKGVVKGLDAVISLDEGDLAKQVNAFTGGKPMDVVYDGVGAATFERSLELIRKGGYAVLFGKSSGNPSIPSAILREKQINFLQPTLGSYIQSKRHLEGYSSEVFAAFQQGILGDFNPTRFPLSAAVEAHRKLENRETTGPILLIPGIE